MAERAKVCIYSPAWPLGVLPNGLVAYSTRMYRAFRALGARCFVLANRAPEGISDPDVHSVEELDPGVGRLRTKGRKLIWRFQNDGQRQHRNGLRIGAALRALHRRVGLDVFQMEESHGWAVPIRRLCPVPVVVRLSGPWFLNGKVNGVPDDASYRYRVRVEGRGIAAADGVYAPAHDVLDRVRSHYGLGLPDARVINTPVELAPEEHRWSLGGCDRRRVVFVGRFDRHKGGDIVLDAFARLRERHPEATLTFVGPDRGLIEGGATVGLEEYVRDRLPASAREGLEILGSRPSPELPAIRQRALVTVVASRWENLANTLLEAVAAGCPVVASRVGGLPEVVRHEENGLLFEGGDASDLARQLSRLLDDPDLAARLGQRALEDCARRLSPEVVAGKTLALYDEVLARAGEGSTRR